ncbi:phosphate/phosphite/phosphonate ABC transporter substrate-binding protein [Paenibacillus sp. CAA11]|uniref:phosphate/phosphite/phosphonate ABC transporter substrate-binding protein n=1 Tax=Paenibacillus sp. CAA11 TaxID=1532905 RepID=UPI002680238A|nr:phosphate/phosphite/phosphonate ABC transporter substrate-binding protein [Paenibacillus sp. CAA11]
MFRKKFLALCMTFAVAASITACGSNSSNSADNKNAANTGNGTKTETPAADTSTGFVPKELRVQFVPSQNAETLEAKTKPLATLLQDKLGIPVTVSVSTDYNTIVEAMASKQIDIGFLPPNAYVQVHDNKKAGDLLLQAQRYGVKDETGEPTEELVDFYKAEIVVMKDSPIKKLEDLKGKKMGWQDVTSSAGYVFPAAEMKKAGVDPDTDVQGVTIKGHDAAIMALLNGQVDAVAVFQDARNNVKKDVPDVFEKTRILHYTVGIPNDTVTVRSDMDNEWRTKIQQAFMDIVKDPEGGQIIKDIYTHAGYTPGDDKNFEPVREYAKLVEGN